MTRRLIFAAVVALVAIQAALPLHYYLAGGDPYDERFAWRMFSAIRVTSCHAMSAERRAGEVDLSAVPISGGRRRGRPYYGKAHVAWRALIQRNRLPVIEKYLAHRCAQSEMAEVRVTNRCVAPGGERLPELRWHRACATGEVQMPSPDALTAVRGTETSR